MLRVCVCVSVIADKREGSVAQSMPVLQFVFIRPQVVVPNLLPADPFYNQLLLLLLLAPLHLPLATCHLCAGNVSLWQTSRQSRALKLELHDLKEPQCAN